jgi:hypothetical protein
MMQRAVLPFIRNVDREEFTDYGQRKREPHRKRMCAGNAGLMGLKLASKGKLGRPTHIGTVGGESFRRMRWLALPSAKGFASYSAPLSSRANIAIVALLDPLKHLRFGIDVARRRVISLRARAIREPAADVFTGFRFRQRGEHVVAIR